MCFVGQGSIHTGLNISVAGLYLLTPAQIVWRSTKFSVWSSNMALTVSIALPSGIGGELEVVINGELLGGIRHLIPRRWPTHMEPSLALKMVFYQVAGNGVGRYWDCFESG